MLSKETIKSLARQQTREMLGRSGSFSNLTQPEQLSLYRDVYEAAYENLLGEHGNKDVMAEEMRRPKKEVAGDLIDPEKHYSKRIEQAGELAGEFVREVDFPGFVRDLLKGVFDANLEVTLKQMETYKDLLKAAASSISKFVKDIDNTAAFGYLAENQPEEFNLDFDDDDKDEEGNAKAVLTDKEGNKLDLGDNEVKAKIMEAKIAMAKEHRALLRESLLMGITRLVVEKGIVKASVLFDMKAQEKIRRKDRAGIRESTSVTKHFGGGFFGFIGGGRTRTSQSSRLTVSSVKSEQDASLAAKVTGYVEINFKSDYFKLDNFAAMYAPQLAPQAAPKEGESAPKGSV